MSLDSDAALTPDQSTVQICVGCGSELVDGDTWTEGDPETRSDGTPILFSALRMAGPDNWCHNCMVAESQRNAQEDSSGEELHLFGRSVAGRSRPPKYMLPRSQWAEYGYDSDT